MTNAERAQAIYKAVRDLDQINDTMVNRTPLNSIIGDLLYLACDRCHGIETTPEPDDSSPNVRARCPDCLG